VVGWTSGRGRGKRQWKGAKVDRKNKGTGGPVDWWERDEQEMQCKCAKVNVSGLVGEWTGGYGE
jgi:hypothetical protein